jgi:hypothetical protein
MSDTSPVPAARSLASSAGDERPANPTRVAGPRVAAIGRTYETGSAVLARLVRLVLGGVELIIVAGILLALLRANSANGVVSEVHGWGRWLVGPFDEMFRLHRARVGLAVNWGLTAVVYLIAGTLISRLIGRSGNRRTLARGRSIPQPEVS